MLALIDGDVVAFHACPPRWGGDAKDGVVQRKVDAEGNYIEPEYTKEEDEAYLRVCWRNFQAQVRGIVDDTFAHDFLMAVKSPTNFRDTMYPEYKQHRRNPNKRNEFVPVLRDLAVLEDLSVYAHDMEADDLIRMWAETCRKVGQDFIICSIDKDLRCIAGKHWHLRDKVLVTVTEEEALRFYYEQLLKGDPTDNIPGVPRVGDKTATKLLADYDTEEEYQSIVVDAYLKAYGEEDWLNYLVSNGKMIHIMRHPQDYFNCLNWPIIQELL